MKPGSPLDVAVTMIAAIAGAALVTAGAWMVHPAAGLIFAGCFLLEVSIGLVYAPAAREPKAS